MKARQRKPVPPETMALVVIIVGILIYMIPNSTLTAIGFLVFGAMAGFTQFDSKQTTQTVEGPKHGRQKKSRYTRFKQGTAG